MYYVQYFPYAKEAKENTSFDFWIRPTLSWDLKCDVESYSRKDILDAFTNVDNVPNLSFIIIQWGAIALAGWTIMIGFFECLCSVCSGLGGCKSACCTLVTFFIGVVIQAGCIGAILWFSLVSI